MPRVIVLEGIEGIGRNRTCSNFDIYFVRVEKELVTTRHKYMLQCVRS